MKKNILLWGTGYRVKNFIEKDYFRTCNIMGFVDTYKKNNEFMNYKVYSPDELQSIICQIDYLILANQYFAENLEICLDLGIMLDKIVLTYNVQEPFLAKNYLKLKEISVELFESVKNEQFRLVKINEFDLKDSERIIDKGKYSDPIYIRDYFRFRTFEFVAREIKEKGVSGAVAELGVFRGTFSSMINEIFNERTIYLFDTFDGFSNEESEKEVKMGRCNNDFVLAHKETSVDRMLKNLSYPEKSVICKGFFPDAVTKEAEDEKYAFVSIDVDFEESTYQGLNFFYPRLSEGGVIFVHDYNTFYLGGVKKAVQRFEKDNGLVLKKVPLADRAGTLVIIK